MPSFSVGQNLVPNPSFEVYDYCPYPWDITGPLPCVPWISVSSVNYFNVCNPGPVGVPYNFRGFQYAHTGDAYVGGYQKSGGAGEPFRVQLLEVLEPATCYYVSFWTSLANQACGSDHMGVFFTEEGDGWPTGTPQIDWNEFMLDTANWMLIEGYFIAFGGEQFLTICDCYPDAVTNFDPTCPDPGFPETLWSYYYFDDVLVEESITEVIDIDLGGPIEACNYYVLDAGISGVNYHWSDGSSESTITVTASGTYSLVVYDDNCGAGYAEVDVTILGSSPVELGPDTFYCSGDNYTISLDPDAGEYQWSDGTTFSSNTFEEPGIYSVVLDDGCDISYSEFILTELQIPDFNLGPDEILCDGDNIVYNLDPLLGDFLWQDGNTFPFYIINDPGTYALTISNSCYSFSDEIVVTELDEPVFDLGLPSAVICNNDNLVFQFEPALGDFNWQDGSNNSVYTVTSPGIYALTISNPCGTQSDQIEVFHQTTPLVELGDVIQLCPGEAEILDIGNNFGTITWQNGASDPQFIVTSSGLYSVTVANDCGVDSDSVNVEIAPTLMGFSLGPDVTVCPGQPLLLEVPMQFDQIIWNDFSTSNSLSVTSSGSYSVTVSTLCEVFADTIVVSVQNDPPDVELPADFALCQNTVATIDANISNVNYLWNTGSQLSQINVTSPGVYSLTVTNSCGSDVDSVIVTSGGLAPSVFLGPDTSICIGQNLELNPTFFNVDSWQWMDGTNADSLLASAGIVFIDAVNSCGVASDTINIAYFPALPSINLGQDTAICPGHTISLSIPVADVDILWSNGSIDSVITSSGDESIVATIANECQSISDTIDISLLPAPQLDLGPDQPICPGETVTIDPEISNVSFTWHDGSSLPVYQTTIGEIVILTVANSCGFATDTIHVIESTDGPQLNLGPDLKACESETVIIPAGISGVEYLWNDGSTSDELTALVSGMYSLTVTNACGTDTDTIEVVIEGFPPQTYLGNDTTLCENATLLLTADKDVATSSIWHDGTTSDQFEVSVSGIYTLTQTNDCGVDIDTIVVDVSGTAPIVSLGKDTVLCTGSAILLSVNIDMATATWQDGSTGHEFLVTSSGIYHVELKNHCGQDTDTIQIDINKTSPVLLLGTDTILCNGSILQLDVSTIDANEIIWQDGSEGNLFLATIPGIYFVTASNECGAGRDSIEIGFIGSPPAFDLGRDTTLCLGESIILVSPTGPYDILWQDGSTNTTLMANEAITYSLQLRNVCGVTSDQITLTHDLNFPEINLPATIDLCSGGDLVLDADQYFNASYLWSTGETTPSITISTPGSYYVSVFTHCNSDSGQIDVVSVNCEIGDKIFIPNVFSPNDDQLNDVFSVLVGPDVNIESIKGTIYDRWGNVVYSSTADHFTWNGKMNDDYVQSGVYPYVIEITYTLVSKEKKAVYYGDITLIK